MSIIVFYYCYWHLIALYSIYSCSGLFGQNPFSISCSNLCASTLSASNFAVIFNPIAKGDAESMGLVENLVY